MQDDRERKHKAASPSIRDTSGTSSRHERSGAEPDTKKLSEPGEVWKDDERTPRQEGARTTGAPGRVADAGDVGGGAATPYGTETQADSLARQTKRRGELGKADKPTR